MNQENPGEHRSAAERHLAGVGASDGIVVGQVHLLADVVAPNPDTRGCGGPDEQARAAGALQTVAARLGEASLRLRAAGRDDDAEILEASQMMADDPSLLDEVTALAATMPAVAALLEATERQADLLAAIPDPYLAARAADVRRLGKQAARIAMGVPGWPPSLQPLRGANIGCADVPPPHAGDGEKSQRHSTSAGGEERTVIVARDLGPADFAEIELAGIDLGGIALAEGSGTSHAAIMARALGVPLVVGLGDAVMAVADGATVVVDGTAGHLIAQPTPGTLQTARAAVERQRQHRATLAAARTGGAVTADGHPIRLLVNASTAREAHLGLEAGAQGIGLLRTELGFLEAAGWPTAAEHAAVVQPVLHAVGGRLATVRTLDFGADKTPPFLRERSERGIALQLAADGALAAQLHGLLQAQGSCDLRIMLPLVESSAQLATARDALVAAHAEVAAERPVPPLGAMIETRAAVQVIDTLAAAADFLSIGTNDLAGDILGVDRLTPAATVRSTADPRVLQAIQAVTTAASAHGRTVEVCGEAAGDPRIAVLLLGLGVSELSVAPSRLDEVRSAIQRVTLTQAVALAAAALDMESADAVLALFDPPTGETAT